MKKILFFTALTASLIIALVSCKDGLDLDALRAEEVKMLEEYIEKNGIETTPTKTGMYYIETVAGTGDSLIKVGDRVEISYVGTLLSTEKEFDKSDPYEPYKFTVGSSDVIAGMSEGMTYMRLGGKARLIIPSNLAYGASNSSGLPRFSTLIFDVEVLKHTKSDSNK